MCRRKKQFHFYRFTKKKLRYFITEYTINSILLPTCFVIRYNTSRTFALALTCVWSTLAFYLIVLVRCVTTITDYSAQTHSRLQCRLRLHVNTLLTILRFSLAIIVTPRFVNNMIIPDFFHSFSYSNRSMRPKLVVVFT